MDRHKLINHGSRKHLNSKLRRIVGNFRLKRMIRWGRFHKWNAFEHLRGRKRQPYELFVRPQVPQPRSTHIVFSSLEPPSTYRCQLTHCQFNPVCVCVWGKRRITASGWYQCVVSTKNALVIQQFERKKSKVVFLWLYYIFHYRTVHTYSVDNTAFCGDDISELISCDE